jgi:hypothetical protein
MIFERDESDTDATCHRGESLQKVAVESPEKWYIPLEHYTRVTENLCFELRELHDLRDQVWALKWIAGILFVIVVAYIFRLL